MALPLAPMLARLSRELPRGPLLHEPRWDGFRCLAFVEGGGLRFRHPARLVRFRPDREPRSCELGQLAELAGAAPPGLPGGPG